MIASKSFPNWICQGHYLVWICNGLVGVVVVVGLSTVLVCLMFRVEPSKFRTFTITTTSFVCQSVNFKQCKYIASTSYIEEGKNKLYRTKMPFDKLWSRVLYSSCHNWCIIIVHSERATDIFLRWSVAKKKTPHRAFHIVFVCIVQKMILKTWLIRKYHQN